MSLCVFRLHLKDLEANNILSTWFLNLPFAYLVPRIYFGSYFMTRFFLCTA